MISKLVAMMSKNLSMNLTPYYIHLCLTVLLLFFNLETGELRWSKVPPTREHF